VGVAVQMTASPLLIEYEKGTLVLSALSTLPEVLDTIPFCKWDARIHKYRAKAFYYRFLLQILRTRQIPYEDRARQYEELSLQWVPPQTPFPHQQEALQAWLDQKKKGVVVLPTGAGKTYLALLAIQATQRSTLVVSPTLDLMNQWYELLSKNFQQEVGILGGGYYEIRPLTVTTYDSGHRHMDSLGNRFGFLIFDECHHLPGPLYALSAELSLAPFRLGLTATPERSDGQHLQYGEWIGKEVYRKEIQELAGDYLATYETRRVFVELSPEEREAYQESRKLYIQFLRSHRISMASPLGWQRFIMESSFNEEGRQAFLAYRKQKELAQGAPAKIRRLEQLLQEHLHDQILVFTNDNQTVYELSRLFLFPAITHQTKTKERKEILENFNHGIYKVLLTSKVLNEGINIPQANVAIILSGSGSTREHVQRLGRILRKVGDKKALLYELVTRDTSEESISVRRRDHQAYQQKETEPA
jgi:superfamily II DNA or RNA helicase